MQRNRSHIVANMTSLLGIFIVSLEGFNQSSVRLLPDDFGGDMAGLGVALSHVTWCEPQQRQIWEFSTRSLNLFHPTLLSWETSQWLHFNRRG